MFLESADPWSGVLEPVSGGGFTLSQGRGLPLPYPSPQDPPRPDGRKQPKVSYPRAENGPKRPNTSKSLNAGGFSFGSSPKISALGYETFVSPEPRGRQGTRLLALWSLRERQGTRLLALRSTRVRDFWSSGRRLFPISRRSLPISRRPLPIGPPVAAAAFRLAAAAFRLGRRPLG